MRKLVVNTFVTLDGVMQAPGGPEEDTTGGFKYGGWSFYYWDDIMGQSMDEFMGKPFDLLLGRKTYEIFAAYWPFIENDPIADKFNTTTKYVVSTTMKNPGWEKSVLISRDVVQSIKKLKEGDGPELQVHGSGNLLQTLFKNNLVDKFQLMIFPVTVGNGKRLFAEGSIPGNFKLTESKTSDTGVLIAVYEPAGELKTGSFAQDQPTEAELARRKAMEAGK